MKIIAKIVLRDGNPTDNPNLAGAAPIKDLAYDGSFLNDYPTGAEFYIVDAAIYEKLTYDVQRLSNENADLKTALDRYE